LRGIDPSQKLSYVMHKLRKRAIPPAALFGIA